MQNKLAYLTIVLSTILVHSVVYTQSGSTGSLGATINVRTQTIYKRCPLVRQTFYNKQINDSQSFGRKQTAASLQLNGDALIRYILISDTQSATAQAKKSLAYSIIYIIFMVIGLLIMIIAFPFLIWCFCCPNSCPPCDGCRSGQKQPYTQCQRTYPAYCTIIFCLIAIGAMIAIFVVNPQLQTGYSQSRCAIAILMDDLINGNYTRDGTQYFIGLQPLKVNLTSRRMLTNENQNYQNRRNLQIFSDSPLIQYARNADNANSSDIYIDNELQDIQNKYIGPISIAIYVIAGVAVLFSLIMIVSACCICLKHKYFFRNSIYFSCIVLTFMGILMFILSLVMSAVTAGTHYGCQYFEGALVSRSQFIYRMKPIFYYQVLTNMIAQCAADDGSGKILNASLLNQPNQSNLNRRLLAYVTQLNCKVLGEDIRLAMNTGCTQIFNYAFAMRIITIIGSFALLMVMFCSVCLGIRAYKSQKWVDQISNPKPKDYEQKDSAQNQLYIGSQSQFGPAKPLRK